MCVLHMFVSVFLNVRHFVSVILYVVIATFSDNTRPGTECTESEKYIPVEELRVSFRQKSLWRRWKNENAGEGKSSKGAGRSKVSIVWL